MGALQAQDYRMAKWALGVRLPGSTVETIEAAIARGDIIRTHLLRATWHFVLAKDLGWILELTAPRIKIAMRSRHKQLRLTKKLISKSNQVIKNALADKNYLTRKKLVDELEDAGFENKNNLASHLLLRAELDGIICSGPSHGKNYTYAVLNERVPIFSEFTKEEALARLAQTYFRSHGPATLEDFTWWSGLTKTSARKALAMIKPGFISKEVGGKTYWFPDSVADTEGEKQAYLLPAYDEFIISYKDRRAAIVEKYNAKAVSNNGIFRPVIVVDGQVVGIWKRTKKKEHVLIETAFFREQTFVVKKKVEDAAGRYVAFLQKELEINFETD